MLTARYKDKPLERAVTEVVESADHSSIPFYIEAGKRYLREAANKAREDIKKELETDTEIKNEE